MNKPELNAVALPRSLKVLAWFLIIIGATSLIGGAVSLISVILGHRLFFCELNPTDILAVFAGRGLLQRKRFWRDLILACCWITFIVVPLLSAYSLISRDADFRFNLLGIHADTHGNPVFTLLASAFIVVNFVVIYRILVGKSVSACFSR